MTLKEDIPDLFEANMTDKEQLKTTWAHHLIALLNPNCKAAVSSLPLEQRYNYKQVTDLLLKTCQQSTRYPGKQLLEGGIRYREMLRATVVKLTRLAVRYALEEDGATARDKMVMEIPLRSLPKHVTNYVREKEPSNACEAADLASKYLSREGIDKFSPKTSPGSSKRSSQEGVAI